MKSPSKTPYEIRLDLLQLAFDILSAKHAADGNKNGNGNNTSTSPTTEEVLAEAEKMNAFISKDVRAQ